MAQDLPGEMFRWIVEALPEAVVYSDREGIIRLWNRGAETILVSCAPSRALLLRVRVPPHPRRGDA
jgi:PAS domain-containing protein